MSVAERLADDLLYQEVPKDFFENLDWRKRLIVRASEDDSYQEALWIACSRSILFWVNSFCWLYEPRDWKLPDGTPMPFGYIPWVSYPYQDEFFLTLDDCIGREDLVVNKTRDMGASYMILAGFLHPWQFSHRTSSFLCVSRNESYVDASDNPKSLFWKMDCMLSQQPGWMLPTFSRLKMLLVNEETGSVINGESTTGQVARGDRRTAILMDEFASFDTADGYRAKLSAQHSTNCRIFNSTPQGRSNAFHDVWESPDIRKFGMHWTIHPIKSRNLYLDKETGKQRSPWYDDECKRCTHDWEIKSELDMDFMGSEVQFFDSEQILSLITQECMAPIIEGEVVVDMETCAPRYFEQVEGGRLRLWKALGPDGFPVSARYVAGVDVSMGTGSSNSVISIADRDTGEKVAEFSSPNVSPHELARMSVCLCRFFHYSPEEQIEVPAFLIWEHNGPGAQFTRAVLDFKFNNFFFRQREDSISRKSTDRPGFWSDKNTKRTLLSDYKRALQEGEFINRSKPAVQECLEYIFNDSGEVVHSKAIRSMDPSAARDNHGDHVIADALAWRGMRETPKRQKLKVAIPEGSFAHRQRQARQVQDSGRFRW